MVSFPSQKIHPLSSRYQALLSFIVVDAKQRLAKGVNGMNVQLLMACNSNAHLQHFRSELLSRLRHHSATASSCVPWESETAAATLSGLEHACMGKDGESWQNHNLLVLSRHRPFHYSPFLRPISARSSATATYVTSMPESKHLPLVPAPANKATAASNASTPLAQRLVFGALAGMGAATFCHPLDVIRVQMQTEGVQYKNTFDAATKIYSRSGLVEGLYAGVSAAYLRQWMYGSFRIGIYSYLL